MFSKTELIGHLGAEPYIQPLPSGKIVAKLRIATTETFFNKVTQDYDEETEWHFVEFFGSTAAYIERRMPGKGSLVRVEGRNKTEKFENAQGNTQYFTKILGDKFKILVIKKGDVTGESKQAQEFQTNKPRTSQPTDVIQHKGAIPPGTFEEGLPPEFYEQSGPYKN